MSADAFDQERVWDSARLVAHQLTDLGLEAQILTAADDTGRDGRPAVVARTPRIEGAPTVLLYAHHDVQPPGDDASWTTPPFEPTIRGDRLYGRGTSDDGAGIAVHLGALRTLITTGGADDAMALDTPQPLNVTVFIEGEEEIGSPSFANFLATYHELLEADYIIVADSDNWKVGHPALTASLRGVVSTTVTLRVLEHGVHSGMFGGPILDAVTLSARLIATLHREDGSVAVDLGVGSEESDVEWDETEFRADASLLDGVRLAGRGDLASRMWTQPAISIIGFDATSVAEASNTIIPAARFTVSMRIPGGIDPAVALEKLEDYLRLHVPFGAHIEFSDGETGPSYQADLDSAAATIAHRALSEAWGVPSVNIGVGGSIPFISDFQHQFPGAEVIVTGVEDPATNAHAQDESQHLGDLKCAILAEAMMLRDFSQCAR